MMHASSIDFPDGFHEPQRPLHLESIDHHSITIYPPSHEESSIPLLGPNDSNDSNEMQYLEKRSSKEGRKEEHDASNTTHEHNQLLPMATSTQNDHHFVPALEGLRGVAVCMTMACHIIGWPHPEGEGLGSMGVTIFFCLSGYLITGVLLRLQSNDGLSYRHLIRFYSDRMIRLGPALIFMVACTYYYCKRLDKEVSRLNHDATLTLFYLGNIRFLWLNDDGGVWGHTWSLACEEQYYIMWSLALPLIIKMKNRRRNIVLYSLTIAFAILRINLAIFPSYLLGIDYYFSLWGNIWKMLLGSTIQIISIPQYFRHHYLAYVALFGYGFTIAALYLPQPNYGTISEAFGKGAIGMQTWADLCAALFTILFITAVDQPSASSSLSTKKKERVLLLEGKTMRFIGKVSYPLYLWQTVLIHIRREQDVYGNTALAILAAMLSTYWIEIPISTLYKKWKARLAN